MAECISGRGQALCTKTLRSFRTLRDRGAILHFSAFFLWFLIAFYVVLFPLHVCLSFPSEFQRRPFSLLIYFCRLILFSPASPVTFLLALVFSGTVLVKNKRQRSSPISWAAICSSSGLLTTAASSRIQCPLRKLSISWHAFLSL